MSQITRCPACGTQFKVVADQLRISDGWVRCGQCQEVFDATQSLQPRTVAQSPAAAQAVDAVQESIAPAGYELPAAVEDEGELPLDVESEARPVQPPEFETTSASAPEVEPEIEPEVDVEPEAASVAEKAAPDLFAMRLDEILPAAEPGFVRAARRKAFWLRPGIRAALGLVCVGLLLGLAAQVALQQRNALAAWQPSLRPTLQSLCELTGCSLAARQDIAQLVIASSGFTRTADADSYRFSLTIENQASTELAMPAVELTLTDLQDRPVLRRVLLPAQLQAPATLAAQAEWSGSIALVAAADTRIAGYRALVFYP